VLNVSILTNLWSRVQRLKPSHWLYLVLNALVLTVGFLLVSLQHVVTVAIGASLVAAGIAGVVMFLHVWLSEDRFRRLDVLQKLGLVEGFEARSVRIKHEYDRRIAQASEGMDIMGFGLRHLRQDYHEEFRTWGERVKVRILLLDPEFFCTNHSLANQRDKEEKDQKGTIAGDVHAFVRACAPLISRKNSKLQVRLYRCLPSVNIFRIDDELLWGPYLLGDVSRNFPTFLVQSSGPLYRRLVEHFNAIWEDAEFSRAVPSEWFTTDENKDPDKIIS
jgi:hypothetical protein